MEKWQWIILILCFCFGMLSRLISFNKIVELVRLDFGQPNQLTKSPETFSD